MDIDTRRTDHRCCFQQEEKEEEEEEGNGKTQGQQQDGRPGRSVNRVMTISFKWRGIRRGPVFGRYR